MKWQTKESLVELTCELVSYESVTGSAAERDIVHFIEGKLMELRYFQQNKEHLQTHPLSDGRKFLTALVKSKEKTKRTIILTGHVDVVDVDDFGEWKELAFQPIQLTEKMLQHAEVFPEHIKHDLQSGEWMFGRGVMDMKGGIALCMSMLQLAARETFAGNILFLAVPDEEVNSVGMREATPTLLQLAKEYDLTYELVWSTEPTFSRFSGDDHLYIYTGSIGKILPCFYCYGKETHVAEPFSGLNGNFMASYITKAFELNSRFSEKVGDEHTPPPTNLMQFDLKKDYSVQIPHAAVTVFNMMVMEKMGEEITDELLEMANEVGEEIVVAYEKRKKTFFQQNEDEMSFRKINVFTYEKLVEHAVKKVGKSQVETMIWEVIEEHEESDERFASIQIVHKLTSLCKELAPVIVLFYAPPYYPAISSKGEAVVDELTKFFIAQLKEKDDVTLKVVNYFPGLSDLSYVSLDEEEEHLSPFIDNMPLWGRTYELPLKAMKELRVPVISFGPYGKDAHRMTERIHIPYSFELLPQLMKKGIQLLFSRSCEKM